MDPIVEYDDVVIEVGNSSCPIDEESMRVIDAAVKLEMGVWSFRARQKGLSADVMFKIRRVESLTDQQVKYAVSVGMTVPEVREKLRTAARYLPGGAGTT